MKNKMTKQEEILRNIDSRLSYMYLVGGKYQFPNSYEGDILKLIKEYIDLNYIDL